MERLVLVVIVLSVVHKPIGQEYCFQSSHMFMNHIETLRIPKIYREILHSNICLSSTFNLFLHLRICLVHIKNCYVKMVIRKGVTWNSFCSVIEEILLIYLSHDIKLLNSNHCQFLRPGFTILESKI